jgi:UDP-N-acetylmuramate dehydrogenase
MKEFQRKKKTNQPLNFPSAGCIFKNPKFRIRNKKLLEEFPEIKTFRRIGIISAGYLIDRCGLKGKQVGKAKISEIHANFIVNLGGAKAKEVLDLINLIKKTVKKKFKIDLKEEVVVL